MKIPKQTKIKLYSDMYTIRKFEEAVRDLFKQGLIRGSTHVYIGEEAVAAGACACLDTRDYIVSTHRGHGHCLAKGGDPYPMMAELLGKSTGYCRGKGGSMHIADPSIGILGAVGIVGSGLPIALGAALSSKTLGDGRVTLAFFGDGASNNGTFHECLNMASVWKLPIVFICENNLYAITVSCSRSTALTDIAGRASGYGIEGITVDGNDAEAVYSMVKKAVAGAREGFGPTLVEAKTYRQEGHWIGDPQVYRNKKEVMEWKKRDPIKKYADKLINEKVLNRKDLEDIGSSIGERIRKAVDMAREDSFLEPSKVEEDIYSP